jgi:acylaminoacyl-peptidase
MLRSKVWWGLVLAAALAASEPARAEGTDKLSWLDVFNLQLAGDPQIAPDGKHIIYVRRFCDVMTDRRYSNLWIINADGTDHRALTTGPHSDANPRWSPDGTQIIFIADRDGSPQIYRRWMDTGQTAKITNLTEAPTGIAWSPDGKWVSFTAHVPAKPKTIAAMPPAPEGAKWAPPVKVIDELVYRFNGAGYLKAGYHQLFVVPADGGAARQVSHGDFQHGGPASFGASEAEWTPDGKYLILSTNRHPDYDRDPLNSEVYEFAVADGAVRALTSRKGPDNNPRVSPDGKLIAYVGFDDRYQGYQVRRLYVMNRDGSNPHVVTGGLDRDVVNPRWAHDGSAIYFTSDSHGNTGLYLATLEGQVRELANNLGSTWSAYGTGSTFSVADDGTFATTHTRPDRPGDILVGKPQGGTKVVTAVNEGLVLGKKLGQVEEIWYESSKDHRKIQGWILKPPDFDASKKYPLVLEIHGGPFADYGDRFDLEKQLMAAHGYVVLYTNPRGSTSYGEEFGNLIHHAYPGDDFYDLNSGVDAVLARGYIDPERLYVTGGSGGGVLTCWVIGHTPRFRAAVTVYPVINWYSFVLTSDIGNFAVKYWFPGYPWDQVEHYEKRSLLSVVKNVKTPTMVLTGEADYRTPMSDSEQYYQALKLLGVESVLVRVPEEPHGLTVRPSHHMAKVLNIVSWFDRHGGAGKDKQPLAAARDAAQKAAP